MTLTEEQRDQMQRAFEASSLYFNGETPTARVENWRVWVEAWKCALAAHNAGAQEPVAWRVSGTYTNGLHFSHLYTDKATAEKSAASAAMRVLTPLYTHRQPIPQTDAARDAKDAKRYRLLRERDFVRADNPNTLAYHCVGIFTSWLPAATIDRDGLDAVLDAEIERLDRAKGE